MKKTFLPAALGALVLASVPALAAPRQYVIIVAEGASPQVLSLGKDYLRSSNNDPALTTSFDALMDAGKMAPTSATALADMKGILSTAKANGFKTGLVTTGDVSQVAPLFYNLDGDTATALSSATAQYDFLGGGGQTTLANAGAQVKAAGGTYVTNSTDLSGDLKGRVLSLQNPGALDYALDRDPAQESGLAEMASIAMDDLGDAPYVLIVHDGLFKQAIDTHDTPALLEEFRELDLVASDALSRHDANPDLGIATLMTGSDATPQFMAGTTTQAQSDAFFIVSNLGRSFAGTQAQLKGADVATITAFADPEEGTYRGWKISEADKARIAAGTLDPETAVRASYEPVLRLEYAPTAIAPAAYTVGIDASAGLVPALKAAVATPATTMMKPAM